MPSPEPPSPRSRPRRFRDVAPARRGLVLAWWSFTITFGILRLLTLAVHERVAGLGDASPGGVHLHHYLWGILLISAVGVLGLADRSDRSRAWMGMGLGVGLALIVDEAALLVALEDVYWEDAGWSSVGAAVLLIGVGGSLLALTRSPGRGDGD